MASSHLGIGSVAMIVTAAAAHAAFNPAMHPSADPASYGTLLQTLDVATTGYVFPVSGGFSSSGYVEDFSGDTTGIVSRVYRVDTAQTFDPGGADELVVPVGSLAFSYTIDLVTASTNTVKTVSEFQVGLLDFGGGQGMDGTAVIGRGFNAGVGVDGPVGGSAGDLSILGAFGASHDWAWAVDAASQLENDQTIELIMFTLPRLIREGVGSIKAPPGQTAGADPNASNFAVLIPAIPAPGAGITLAFGALAMGRRRR